MGAITGLVGLGGGSGGTSFDASQNPLQPGQLQAAQTGTANSLQSQNNLLTALQGQNGLQNQNQVYGQLQGVASGAVNPAQAQFAQNTNQNVANQAALMAGQRGASSNVGLIARQAAQQGAATQQQAVGQEATQQATNQINAIGQAGQLATTQAGQQIGQTNANAQSNLANQQQALGAAGQYNATQAGLASTQLQGQQALIGGAANGAAAVAAAADGGELVKMADGGDTPAPAATPAPYAGANGPTSKFGQFLTGAANNNQAVQPQTGAAALQSGTSNLIKALGSKKSAPATATANPNPSDQDWSNMMTAPTAATGGGNASDNQWASAMQNGPVSSIPAGAPDIAGATFAKGGMSKDFRAGGKVNATSQKEKAVKGGNSYANDKIPAVLSEHEIVLPRSVTLSKDPVGEAGRFVAGVIAKRRGRK